MRFSALFHQASKDRQAGHPPIPHDDSLWPREWGTTYYKEYPRLSTVPLSREGGKNNRDIFSVIQTRKSYVEFSGVEISQEELGTLLYFSCGATTQLQGRRFRRAYPSAGGRFPLEVYPFIFSEGDKQDSVSAGIYHYNVPNHALEVLEERTFSNEEIRNLFSFDWTTKTSAVFIITATFWRTQNKYGERGYRYIFLEAGHLAQNTYLVAEALGLKCRALGASEDEKLEQLLGIDGITESVVYAVGVGK